MQLHLIDRGTPLQIDVQTFSGEQITSFKGTYHDTEGRVRLTVEGGELYEHCLQPQADTKLLVSFFREEQKCSFEGRCVGTEERRGVRLVNITMLSAIKVESRRTQKRFEIFLKVNIYAFENGQKGALLGDGETNDVSLDALSITSDVDMQKGDDKRYAAEFTLFNKHTFSIPAKVLVKKDAPAVSAMNYEYVLLFDFTDRLHEKKRLINAFFNELTR
ncbi:MAG: hypothetical protein FWG72_08185 [Oscillospiraceae bacterium]|nr:hypothetical protein [Oscillospiraceae bacterium]